MGDWSDYALRRLDQQREDQRFKDETFLERQRLKRADGLRLWSEIRGIMTKDVEDLNTKAKREILDFDLTPDTEVSINANLDTGRRDLLVSYNKETGVLYWECGTRSGQWEIAVTKDGEVQFESAMVASRPHAIVRKLLDTLLFDD